MTPEERFWAKVNKTATCWLWTRYLNPDGYGVFRLGKGANRGNMQGAHRISYMLAFGPVPDGMKVDHKCHVRHCVRPDHLRAVTDGKNAQNRKGATRLSKTGVRGVCLHKASGKWQAKVGHNRKVHYIGLFDNLEDAEAAVVARREELYRDNEEDAA